MVVAFNRYSSDVDDEIAIVRDYCSGIGAGFAVNNAFSEGGKGAEELARLVVDTIENKPSEPLKPAYEDGDSIRSKIEAVCRKVYGAASVTFSKTAEKMLARISEFGMDSYPVCIAKTQYSFSADQKLYGCPEGFNINIRDLVIN